jgi:hypothetical protein
MADPKGGVRGVLPHKQKYIDKDLNIREGKFTTEEIIEAQERILNK